MKLKTHTAISVKAFSLREQGTLSNKTTYRAESAGSAVQIFPADGVNRLEYNIQRQDIVFKRFILPIFQKLYFGLINKEAKSSEVASATENEQECCILSFFLEAV